jgi:hypothetical protein
MRSTDFSRRARIFSRRFSLINADQRATPFTAEAARRRFSRINAGHQHLRRPGPETTLKNVTQGFAQIKARCRLRVIYQKFIDL